jgi:sugar lactone lactonase YvrE
MGITDKILGQNVSVNGKPHIKSITPSAALAGGEIRIHGSHLAPNDLSRPRVHFGEALANVVISSDELVIARVPDDATTGEVQVRNGSQNSNTHEVSVGILIADNMHPVANPAVDPSGNIFTTVSGSRGQKVPVSVYKIDSDYAVKPFLSDIMNATGLAFDNNGHMYVSSRYDGTVYRVAPNGTMTTHAESMGVATGLAFDDEGSLFVGDRSGTIFKVSPQRDIFVYATLEPSVSAYHLAFGPDGDLYVSGPTTSSFDAVYRVNDKGEVSDFYRGLGRPQGLAFDIDGNLYVAASLKGQRGIVRITPAGEASLAVSGHNIVGLAFAPGKAAIIATTSALHYLNWGIEGMPLFD